MSEFNRLSIETGRWQKRQFPNSDAFAKIAHLREEVDELEVAVKNYLDTPDTYEKFEKWDALAEEAADCLLLLLGIGQRLDLDGDELIWAAFDKLEKNRQRDWGEPKENGVVNHKEDA